MFCDLLGSTALFAEFDPEEMSDLLRSFLHCCAERIEAVGGFVAQFQGDGVIGYFGYIHASESDAERAVRAALAVIEAAPGLPAARGRLLQVRVGISTGLAVVGDPAGEGTRLEQAAVGETLHLASRLQNLASANEIVISEETRCLAGGLFKYRNRGEIEIKGFPRPVQVWSVIGPRRAPSAFRHRRRPLLIELVDRVPEIATLLRLWERAAAGEGHIALLVGDAGIGKSRLIDEFQRRMTGQDHVWLTGEGAQLFGNTPFFAIAQIIRRALDPAGRASPHEFRSRLQHELETAGVDAEDALLLLTEMLDLPAPASVGAVAVAPGERRSRLLAALIRWLEGQAQRQPLVVALDDVHWVDPSSLELAGLAAERIATLPVLILLSMRPGFRLPWPLPVHSSELHLGRVEDADLLLIVARVGSTRTLTDRDIQNVVQRAGGVPLFGIELMRLLAERAANRADREVPATLSDLLTARLDQLGPAKSLAQVAAVAGDEIPFRLLEAIAELPRTLLRRQLATLKKHGILREQGTVPDQEYSFTHSLLRDAAYNSLLRARRRLLHRRAAAVIEEEFTAIVASRPELQAYHWTEAGEMGLAAAAWQQAGDFATARRAFIEAEQAYQNAIAALLELPPSTARDAIELTLQSLLADVLRITRGYSVQRSIDATARARGLADRNGDRAQQLHQIWGAWAATSSAGNYTEAADLAEQFYRLGLADGSPEHIAHAHMMKMTSSYRLGDLSLAEDHFERGEPFFAAAEFRRRPGQTAQVYGNAARIAWIRKNDAAAQNRIDHALNLAKESNNPYDLAYAFYMAAVHLALTESFANSADFAREAIEVSEKYGFPQFATISRVALGRAQVGLGSAAEGTDMIRAGLAGMEATSARVAMTMYMTWLAEAHVFGGAFTQALAQVEDALQVNPQEEFFRPETVRLRGDILAQLGRRDEAERDFFDALALADRMGARRFSERAASSLRQFLRNPGAPTSL